MDPESGVAQDATGLPEAYLADADSSWPVRFDELATTLREELGPEVLAIEHVGSTAIAGLSARPIIDVVVGMNGESLSDPFTIAQVSGSLAELGFTPAENASDATPRRFVRRGADAAADADVMLADVGSARYRDYLALRDCLRTRPEIARAFDDLKREAIAVFHEDRELYEAAKDAFMREAVRLCREDERQSTSRADKGESAV